MCKKTWVYLTICTLLIAGLPLIVGANPVTTDVKVTVTAVEPVGTNGSIDWDKGTVEAIGLGKPSSLSRSPAQALLMARRIAITDARRNLLEAIRGVKIDAETTVQNLETANDTVKIKVSGLVNRAKIIKEQQLADGTYQITMGIKLFGQDSLSEVITNTTKPATLMPLPEPSSDYKAIDLPAYTGLIIDIAALPLSRAMSPAIYDDTGRLIYSQPNLIPDYIISQGMLEYLCTPEDLKAIELGQSRAGVNPILVKAVDLRDHNVNIIISQASADRLLATNAQAGFLPKTMVCVKQN